MSRRESEDPNVRHSSASPARIHRGIVHFWAAAFAVAAALIGSARLGAMQPDSIASPVPVPDRRDIERQIAAQDAGAVVAARDAWVAAPNDLDSLETLGRALAASPESDGAANPEPSLASPRDLAIARAAASRAAAGLARLRSLPDGPGEIRGDTVAVVRALLLQRAEDPEGVIDALDEAARTVGEPASPVAMALRLWAKDLLLVPGSTTERLEPQLALGELAERHPSDLLVRLLLAEVALRNRRPTDVNSALARARYLAPDHPGVTRLRALVLARESGPRAALDYLGPRRAKTPPASPGLARLIATEVELWIDLHDAPAAAQAIEEAPAALRSDPWLLWAESRLARERKDAAALSRVVRRWSEHPDLVRARRLVAEGWLAALRENLEDLERLESALPSYAPERLQSLIEPLRDQRERRRESSTFHLVLGGALVLLLVGIAAYLWRRRR